MSVGPFYVYFDGSLDAEHETDPLFDATPSSALYVTGTGDVLRVGINGVDRRPDGSVALYLFQTGVA